MKYVSECDTCRRVKTDHLRLAKNLQPLSIPEWKWENICMDFIVGLPHTSVGTTQYGSLWTAWLSRLTLYPYPPHTGSNSIPSSTCHTLCAIMVSQRPLSLIEGLSLWHIFGNNYRTIWAPISSSDRRADWMSPSNYWRYASCLCSKRLSKMGQARSTSWVLI
jgi:hypothetical protein